MGWQDRLLDGAYTPPRGPQLGFQYENVSHTVNKKTSSFEFPTGDGTYVQDLGSSGRQFPMRLFFTGQDHDTEANTFMDALLQRGVGGIAASDL